MKYLKIWVDFTEVIEPLTAEEKGRLFEALLRCAETGEEPALTGNERFVWPTARQHLRRTREEYERLQRNGKNGGRPARVARTGTDADENSREAPALPGPEPEKTNPNQSKAYKDNDKEKEKENGNVRPSLRLSARTIDPEDAPGGDGGRTDGEKGFLSFGERTEEAPSDTPAPIAACAAPGGGRTGGETDGSQAFLDRLGEVFGPLNRIQQRNLLALCVGMDPELALYAVDSAVSHGARSASYVERILEQYRRDGIVARDQAVRRDEKRRPLCAGQAGNGPARAGRRVTAQCYENQRDYSDEALAEMLGFNDLFRQPLPQEPAPAGAKA